MLKTVIFLLFLLNLGTNSLGANLDADSNVDGTTKYKQIPEEQKPQVTHKEPDGTDLSNNEPSLSLKSELPETGTKNAATSGLKLSEEQINNLADKILKAHGVQPDSENPESYKGAERLRKIVKHLETNIENKLKEAAAENFEAPIEKENVKTETPEDELFKGYRVIYSAEDREEDDDWENENISAEEVKIKENLESTKQGTASEERNEAKDLTEENVVEPVDPKYNDQKENIKEEDKKVLRENKGYVKEQDLKITTNSVIENEAKLNERNEESQNISSKGQETEGEQPVDENKTKDLVDKGAAIKDDIQALQDDDNDDREKDIKVVDTVPGENVKINEENDYLEDKNNVLNVTKRDAEKYNEQIEITKGNDAQLLPKDGDDAGKENINAESTIVDEKLESKEKRDIKYVELTNEGTEQDESAIEKDDGEKFEDQKEITKGDETQVPRENVNDAEQENIKISVTIENVETIKDDDVPVLREDENIVGEENLKATSVTVEEKVEISTENGENQNSQSTNQDPQQDEYVATDNIKIPEEEKETIEDDTHALREDENAAGEEDIKTASNVADKKIEISNKENEEIENVGSTNQETEQDEYILEEDLIEKYEEQKETIDGDDVQVTREDDDDARSENIKTTSNIADEEVEISEENEDVQNVASINEEDEQEEDEEEEEEDEEEEEEEQKEQQVQKQDISETCSLEEDNCDQDTGKEDLYRAENIVNEEQPESSSESGYLSSILKFIFDKF